MSTKISEMYNETSIQDLPDEMLEKILLFLNFDDRRPALLVCRRWSTLTPLSSVKLVVDFGKNVGQEVNCHRTLLASSRQYKHLVLRFVHDSCKNELLVNILKHFSHKMESLKIISYGLVEEMLITQMLSLCSNLRHLHIHPNAIGRTDFRSHVLEILPMHKLEELYLGNHLIPNMMTIAPNIMRLHMRIEIYPVETENFLRHLSSQLVELNIIYHSKDYVLRVCEMQFPLLEKLEFECLSWSFIPDRLCDIVEKIDLFDHQLPLLKEVTLRCNLAEGIIQNLCRSCVNIQFLWVSMDHFSQDSFRAICELKHLKHLRLEKTTLDAPPDMYSTQTSLQKLTLDLTKIVHNANFNSFVQRAFPNAVIMNLRMV